MDDRCVTRLPVMAVAALLFFGWLPLACGNERNLDLQLRMLLAAESDVAANAPFLVECLFDGRMIDAANIPSALREAADDVDSKITYLPGEDGQVSVRALALVLLGRQRQLAADLVVQRLRLFRSAYQDSADTDYWTGAAGKDVRTLIPALAYLQRKSIDAQMEWSIPETQLLVTLGNDEVGVRVTFAAGSVYDNDGRFNAFSESDATMQGKRRLLLTPMNLLDVVEAIAESVTDH